MVTLDIQGFAAATEGVALKVDSARLPGLLRRSLVVPAGCAALLRDGDGRDVVLKAGGEQNGSFSGVIAKDGEFAVPFQIAALPTREGMTAVAGVEVALSVPPRAIELRELLSTLLRERDRVDVADVRAYLLPSMRAALARFVASFGAEELATQDHRADLEARIREELKPACFSAGLDVREVRHPSFYCEDFEKRRAAEREALEREEDIRRSERLQELKARLEKNEVLKKQEVEELAKVLQYEGILKELSLKTEIDRKRKEGELRRFEALHARMGNDDVKALIFLLEDDRLKADLIRQLVERDMSEEQIRARRSSDLELKMESRIEELSAKLNQITGARERRVCENGTRTRRLYGAYGKSIVAFDPGTNLRRESPKETYALERGSLGYVRSVRRIVTRDEFYVAAGAQRGVYLLIENAPGAEPIELRFPRDPGGQGGANAIAYFDGHVYATHSEMGLFRWSVLMKTPEHLHEAATARHESTRGAHVTADGKLWFASGPDVFRTDLVRPQDDLVIFRGRDEPITSFVVSSDETFAGTRGGRILRWSHGDPRSPRELNVRKAEPIYMLKVAELGGEDHVLVGAKEHGVTAVSLADGRTQEFRASDQIRWVDGGSDFVYGVSRSGYTIHVWEADRPDAEAFELRVPDRLQDVHTHKEPLRVAV